MLATKMPLRDFRNEQDMEAIFREQLEHCGVKFFDCYLLHNMGYNVYAKCLEIANKYHWAMSFAASQEGVSRVLSGMNDVAQVEGNASSHSAYYFNLAAGHGLKSFDEPEYGQVAY